MYSFTNLEPVCCSMSSSNCCFLTCIQISQEAGQVVWYSHLFQNLPQFVVIHTVKGFGVVNKAEVAVFLELSCFCDDPADVGDLISGSSAFSKSSLNIWKFTVCSFSAVQLPLQQQTSKCSNTVHWRRESHTTSVFLPWEQGQIGHWKKNSLGRQLPNMLLEITGEITPERMKRWSQSKKNTQLWMWLVMEVKYDAVKSNIA